MPMLPPGGMTRGLLSERALGWGDRPAGWPSRPRGRWTCGTPPRARPLDPEYVPRLVDGLLPRTPQTEVLRVIEVSRKELLQLIFPDGNLSPQTKQWFFVIMGAVAIATGSELLALAAGLVRQLRDGPGTTAERQDRLQRRLRYLESQREAHRTMERGLRQSPGAGGTEPAEAVPAAETITEKRFLLRDFIIAERYRGLGWAAAAALFGLWCTGVFDKDNPLQP